MKRALTQVGFLPSIVLPQTIQWGPQSARQSTRHFRYNVFCDYFEFSSDIFFIMVFSPSENSYGLKHGHFVQERNLSLYSRPKLSLKFTTLILLKLMLCALGVPRKHVITCAIVLQEPRKLDKLLSSKITDGSDLRWFD